MVFVILELLQREMRLGARYPEGRSGVINASVVTGQGVQALLGAFDTQVKTGQQILADVFEDVIALCLKMDERLFAGEKKIAATSGGARFELSYDPSRDIRGDYTVQVRYGLMSGLDPSRALIFSLQALGADLNLFFFKTASDIATYYKMLTSPSTGGSQDITIPNCLHSSKAPIYL